MPSFRYEASDATGRIERGLLDADTDRAARSSLRARGLTPLAVRAVASERAKQSRFGRRMSDADLAWATRQLSSLLMARLPLDAALTATLEQAERAHVAEALAAVRSDVRAGHRLADALATRPRDFPDIYRALVAAGEASGDLPHVMDKLADWVEERNALRGKVLTAFIYPAVVAMVSVLIVIFLLAYVVPQVVSAFSQARQELPLLTRVVLWASSFVREWGWAVAGGLVLAGVARGWALRNPVTRLAWHKRKLKLPVAGRFILGLDTSRFASTLAILSGSGVSLLRALEAARDTLANDYLRNCVDDAIARVREGAPLAVALQRQKVFPPLLIHLTASGERTGELPAMLQRGSQSLARDLERRALTLTALLEPATILVMGMFVLVIVLAVLMPIIELNELVR